MSDRAVSDLVAFVLTFAIIIASVGTVYALGFGSLADLQGNEQVNSADRTMQGVASAMADVHREGVPGRSITIGLDKGSLRTADSQLIIETDAGGTETIDIGALVIDPPESDRHVAYEGGLSYRAGMNGGVFTQYSPSITCTGNVTVIDLIKLKGQISTSVPNSLELKMERRTSTLRYPNVTAGEQPQEASSVEINVSQTRRPDAWSQYFEVSGDPWTETDDGYECSGVNTVYVRVTVVELSTTF
ncbi:MAG: hypothetical protein V5A34_08165 [Halapricum sp.]